MDIVARYANQLADRYLRGLGQRNNDAESFIDSIDQKLRDIDGSLDRIKFINILLERNNMAYELHKPVCTNPDGCPTNEAHEVVTYQLNRRLNQLGIVIDQDAFSATEKQQADSKLDQILKDLSEIKAGQQVIWEDLSKEIEELRSFYFLGKKKWYQMLLGKGVDMVASGVVSETVAKTIAESLKTAVNHIQLSI